jgi:hypothetical protein
MHCVHRAWSAGIIALLAAMAFPAESTPLTQKLLGAAGVKTEKAAPTVTSVAERRAELEKSLAAAQDAVERERSGRYPVPPGATPSQVTELSWLLGRFPIAFQAQLDLLREIEAARAARETAEDAQATYRVQAAPGP